MVLGPGWAAGRLAWEASAAGLALPRLGMMLARAARPSRSGLRPALRAPLTGLP